MPFNPVKFQKDAKEMTDNLQFNHISAPHIESFNTLTHIQTDLDINAELPHYMMPASNHLVKDSLLKRAIDDIPTFSFTHEGSKISMTYLDYQWDKSRVPLKQIKTTEKRIFPLECRQSHATYKGTFRATLSITIDDTTTEHLIDFGQFPIMVRSNLCHLSGASTKELVSRGEDYNELGGTFIVNGNEKLIRLLIATKRNHPFSLIRSSFTSRGSEYTDKAIMIRSVRPDQTSLTNYLHVCKSNSIMLRFHHNKVEYLIPVGLILKATHNCSDKQIYQNIKNCHQILLDTEEYKINTQSDAISVLGARFKSILQLENDLESGYQVLHQFVLVHLNNNKDKFNLLCLSNH